MAKLSVFTWIGNAAAALCGRHGDVTQQAARNGCSRQTVYDHAAKVQQAVTDAQQLGPSRDELLQENQRLRDENRQLWEELEHSFDCPPDKCRQFAVTAAALSDRHDACRQAFEQYRRRRPLSSERTGTKWHRQ